MNNTTLKTLKGRKKAADERIESRDFIMLNKMQDVDLYTYEKYKYKTKELKEYRDSLNETIGYLETYLEENGQE